MRPKNPASLQNEFNDESYISKADQIIRSYALNNQNNNFTQLMGSDAEVISTGFDGKIQSIEPAASYLIIPNSESQQDFANKLLIVLKVTGSDYMNDKLVSYVTVRFTDIDPKSGIGSNDHYIAPYGEKRPDSAYEQHISPYEKDCTVLKKIYLTDDAGDASITLSDIEKRLDEYTAFSEKLIKNHALNNQNYNFSELMLSDAPVKEEGFKVK